MKTIKFLLYLLFIPLFIMSCDRDYDTPPIDKPVYNGEANITIAELQEKYKAITDPTKIESQYILKARVIANDVSGNIYKQIYIQDNTGGINIGVDQNSTNAYYKVGQEVFIELQDLYMVSYGDELQIGFGGTNANRIPWDIFEEHMHKNGWPDKSKVEPKVVTLDALTDNMVNTLVRVNNISFVNGGKNTFATGDQTTSEIIKDGNGKSLEVRTSSYADFAKEVLPKGTGALVGVLGRYRGTWQFTIRDKNDILHFEEGTTPTPPGPGDGDIFYETFGTKDVSANPRPTLDAYDGYDNGSPVSFSGTGDVRSTKAFDNHVWLKTGEGNLKIEGLNITGKSNVKLSYNITANVYNAADQINVNVIKVKCDGTELTVPSFVLDVAGGYNSNYYTVEISNLPSNISTLEFVADATNTLGFRIDNVKIYTDSSITPTPNP